jgi:hypothetical protein
VDSPAFSPGQSDALSLVGNNVIAFRLWLPTDSPGFDCGQSDVLVLRCEQEDFAAIRFGKLPLRTVRPQTADSPGLLSECCFGLIL